MRVAVDAHHHLWTLTGRNYPWIRERIDAPGMRAIARDFDAAEFRQVLARHGVERSVLVQGEPTVAETDEMLAIARQHGFIAGVVGWIDLEASDAVPEVARRAGDPLFKGLRLWLLRNADPMWILRETQTEGLKAVENTGLCVDALLRPQHVGNLLTALDRHPALRVVVCHGAKPVPTEWTPSDADFQDWARGMKALARRGCFMKLSGIMTESGPDWRPADVKPYVDVILDAFGPERTMWGSDWPVINRAGDYAGWLEAIEALTADLPVPEKARLFGGTAAEFYRLDQPASSFASA
ncbi:MAG: amidohydrolase family protein [Rhizobiaceae bacterium]